MVQRSLVTFCHLVLLIAASYRRGTTLPILCRMVQQGTSGRPKHQDSLCPFVWMIGSWAWREGVLYSLYGRSITVNGSFAALQIEIYIVVLARMTRASEDIHEIIIPHPVIRMLF